jgi:chromosome partitioning protein
MKTICIANRKGGVGKSTVTVNLAVALGLRGYRVLVVDLDGQMSATDALLESVSDEATTAHMLVQATDLRSIIVESNAVGVWVAPASDDMDGAANTIVNKPARETILRRALRPVTGYDVVLIDTPAGTNLCATNAIVAASHVLLPFDPEVKALEGMEKVMSTVEELAAAELTEARLLGCVQVRYDKRLDATEHARAQVREAYGDLLFKSVIRTSGAYVATVGFHRNIFAHEKLEQSLRKGSDDFVALAKEFVRRINLPAPAKAAVAA